MLIVRGIIGALCVLWLFQSLIWIRSIRQLHRLVDCPVPDLDPWPLVSVIIPARDEAETIEAAIRSRLEDDYPRIELIIVDDRSKDATGEIATALVQEDARVRYVRIDDLPEGWLGKVHAMQRGLEQARGDWVLFSDADVHIAPQTMKRAVNHCIEGGFDHLGLIPEYDSNSWLVDAVWAVFLRVFGIMINAAKVRDPGSKTAMGSGAFNLVRREAFQQTKGFEWLRLETTDDMALGMMMKQGGFRSDAMDGRGAASVLIYPDIRSFFHGTEKNAGSLLGPPLIVIAFAAVVWLVLELSPLLALALGPAWLRWLGLIATIAATSITAGSLRINTGRLAAGLLWPIGSLLFAMTLVRAPWLAHKRGGLLWRETFYPTEDILKYRRFKL